MRCRNCTKFPLARSLAPSSALTRSALYPFPRVESQKQSGAELKEDGGGKRKAENTGRGLKKPGAAQ